jgi:hypothetical protein
VFPVRADKTPLLKWKEAASTDPAAIAKMWDPHPLADPARALDATTVVADIDRQPGRNGFEQFRALAGVSVDDVPTLQATTPSGGRHLYFATLGRRYNNNRVPGTTAIDLKTIGGYVVLPAAGNGRKWLAPLGAPLLSAFACFDNALKTEQLVVAPRLAIIPSSPDDPWASRQALIALGRACAKIVAAPCGARENPVTSNASSSAALSDAAISTMPPTTTPFSRPRAPSLTSRPGATFRIGSPPRSPRAWVIRSLSRMSSCSCAICAPGCGLRGQRHERRLLFGSHR